MRRQGLEVTIGQLRRLADELESQAKNDPYPFSKEKPFLVPIINRTKDESDRWELEGVKK